MYTRVKSDKEIVLMRESGRMLATVLGVLSRSVQPGQTTKHLADMAAKELRALGGKPAFLGFEGFPDVLCVSVNEEVVHGIPSARIINDGDIVGMDFGVDYQGMITDSAISMIVGDAKSPRHINLLQTTKISLDKGISAVKPGVRAGDIGEPIEVELNKAGLGIVRDLVGHGVGHELHEEPSIPNYGPKGIGPVLKKGMTIAIEPMATLGGDDVFIAPDGWTVKTADGSLAAHYEHTVLITDDGAEILTML